jgi:putative glycosyltransferase
MTSSDPARKDALCRPGGCGFSATDISSNLSIAPARRSTGFAKMKLSIVTTIYSTADAIEEFYARSLKAAAEIGAEAEIVFVNDASPDNGLEIARRLVAGDARVVVVDLSRNFGQFRALWTGLQHATGELIAILDGDLDEDPLWLVEFHRCMAASGSEVVYGVHREPTGGGFYRAGRQFFYAMLNALAEIPFPRNVVTARLMTRRYLDALLMFEERELFLVGVMYMAGFTQIGLAVDKRSTAPTKYSARRLFWVFVNSVTAFSTAPLVAIFLCGITISIAAVFYIAFLLFRYFWHGIGVEGWTSVMAAIMFFSGILLFFNGVMAIYIGKIFLEVKRRPLSIVRSIYRADSAATQPVSVRRLHRDEKTT